MENKELSLRQQLDALAEEGKEIRVTWEGGNDSGGYNLFIDGVEVNYGDVAYDEIVDVIADTIDYGSWSGDYFADGEVYYEVDKGAFIGSGKETETETISVDASIEIKIPKALNFDTVQISTEGSYCLGEDISSWFRFVINNGPVFPEHLETEKKMEEFLVTKITHILETDESCKNEEISWVGNDWTIRRESFEEDGDDLLYTIDEIYLSVNVTNTKDFIIEIKEEQ